jgi:hypothetical protein
VKAQPLKVTKAPALLMLASSVIPLVLSLIFAPNVFTLVLGLLMPPLFASYLSLRVAASMKMAGSVSPLEEEAEFVEGRLRIGNTYYSFVTVRKIEHSDRFVEPEDVYRLLETLNSSFLYQRYGYTAVLALRKVDVAIFSRKESFKMDVSYYDYETGGGLSRALKAKKHQIKLERIRLGEKPYDIVGIFVLRTNADDVEAVKVAEDSFKSVLSLLGFSISYVRNPKGIMRCIRSIYLPADGVIVPVLEPASVSEVRALTLVIMSSRTSPGSKTLLLNMTFPFTILTGPTTEETASLSLQMIARNVALPHLLHVPSLLADCGPWITHSQSHREGSLLPLTCPL